MRFEDRDPDEQIGIALRHQQLAMQAADKRLETAKNAVYRLWNAAEHVYRMAQGAQVALANNDPEAALRDLEIVDKADLGYHLREARRAINEIAEAGSAVRP